MSGTLPPIESGDDQLADEISDVIERHGRGLDADAISTAIDRVAGNLEADFAESVSANELQHELHQFVDEHDEHMEREEFIATLREIADDLRQGSMTPEVAYRDGEEGHDQVALVFDSAFALRQKLPSLLDVRGYFVECDRVPVVRDKISIVIAGAHVAASVELTGRVLRTAPNGMALKIYDATPGTRRRLRRLARRMREVRRQDA